MERQCSKCKTFNQPFTQSKTLGLTNQFQGKSGRMHYHDSSSSIRSFSCNCGNRYDEKFMNTCWCGWPDNESETAPPRHDLSYNPTL